MKYRIFACLWLAGICCVASAAEKCGWLPTSQVDQALPAFAPWQTVVGGKVGSCKFVSARNRFPSVFGANQMVKLSADEAEALMRTLKEELARSYDVESAPALGKLGFTYKPKAGAGASADRSLFFVGQRGRVVAIGSLSMQKAVTPAQRAGAQKLMLAALAIADDASALDAASNCPYFDDGLIRRLLPGPGFNENVYGANSCMAQANNAVLIVSVIEDANAERLAAATAARASGGCASDPLPKLGKSAAITYNCKQGKPHAQVRFASANKLFDFSFAPGREPTAAERGLLIDLAERAAGK